MRVVAMFRVSTSEQEEHGSSLEAQQRRYRELAAANGWSTVAEYRGSESATQAATERDVLQEVLQCLREEEPDALWVFEQSRLTRGDELDVALLMRELRERSVKVIVNGVVRDLGSIDERFMIGIQSLVDRAEADRIRERVKRGKRERARQGKKNSGAAPYGYRNPPPRHQQRGTLQIKEDEAAIVRRIFEMAAAHKSMRGIVSQLNKEGVPSPKGGSWGRTTIRRILVNPTYIGTHATNVWVNDNGSRTFRLDMDNPDAILVENAHEAIISREVWDAVHSRPKPARTLKPNLLTGLLWAGGQKLGGDASRGVSYYRSRTHKGLPWLEVCDTDETVWQAFTQLAREPQHIEAMVEQSKTRLNTPALRRQVKAVRKRAEKIERRRGRLIDMRADGEITSPVFKEKTAQANEELSATQEEARQLEAQLATADETQPDRIINAIKSVLGNSARLNTAQKRRVLQSAVRRIEVAFEKAKEHFLRDSRGRVTGTAGPKWRITAVTFKLVVAGDRSGCLDTASSDCARRPPRS